MPDYKKMYLTMYRASEDAINTLIAAQRKCEELYLSSSEAEISVLKREKNPGEPGGKL